MGPLRHRLVSRTPVTVMISDTAVHVISEHPVKVNGVVITGKHSLPTYTLQSGIVLELNSGVIMVLRLQRPAVPHHSQLSGVSEAVMMVRQEIERIGPQESSVLILGETGVGKELIARAIHQRSRRASKPFVAVNMGAVPKETAVAELFGYKKGAFTGASADHGGHFGNADGGTLFLDEVGETPEGVQPILLRALENREVQPLGATKVKSIDIRLIAATDANLDQLVEEGSFRGALYHRLGGYQLKVPALRERKEDIAPLFLEFLRKALEQMGQSELLDSERAEPWLRSRIVSQLLTHSWPGNVRELRNVAGQVAAFSADMPRSELPPALVNLGLQTLPPSVKLTDASRATDAEPTTPPPKDSDRPRPSEISDDRLLAALKENAWRIAATARALSISKNSLYDLIDRCPKIRTARDIGKEELSAGLARYQGDLEAMASEMCVSLRALQLRIKELNLS
jgi:two-component system nitrogen regulation response regulator GlnG